MNRRSGYVHPTAEVEDEVAIGDGARVWHHAHVRRGAALGSDCILGKNAFIDEGVRVGARTKIQNNVSVYRGVELGDDVFVGPSAVFTNDLRPRAFNATWQITPTLVQRGASIGANATVVCGVEIGQYAMVAAGSVVTRSVAPHQLVAGNPARPRGWVCACGEVVSRETVAPRRVSCADCAQTSAETGESVIPISRVETGAEAEKLVIEVLRSGRLAQGRKVAELEESFAAAQGVKHVVAVSNGTIALVAALKALGIGPGDEVITTPFSFNATLNAILEVGATARFADICEDYTVDVDSVAALINERTAALLPVHLYGLPADMGAIAELAARHDIAVIEDAAQAHGATVGGKGVGSFGVGTFSLYGTKNITSGEGGLITTDDSALADTLRLLRNQGMRARYDYALAGYNWRLTDLQAAVAIPQVRRLAEINAARSTNAAHLTELLRGTPGLVLPTIPAGRTHVWHQYTVRLTAEALIDREVFCTKLHELGVGNGVYYPRLMHDYPCYQGDPRVGREVTPVAEQMCAGVVSLPIHPGVGERDLDRIATTVKDVLGA